VHARCGLARVLAWDDPQAAREHVAGTLELASSLERAYALCSAAWVELRAGDPDAAASHAGEAEREARATGDRPGIAEALELQGLAARPPSEERLQAAAELWGELGSPIARERTLLALATIRGDRGTAAAIREQLEDRGAAPGFDPGDHGSAPLAIVTLGRFAVLRNGEPVPAAAWQSRKARDLLKLLVARRGRPITRDAALEALWPGEPAGPLANRLSVALSTVRRVLDPDRGQPPDRFITADTQSLALRTDHVAVDVVEFLQAAETAIADAGNGDRDVAEARLRAAERLYTGDFLEDDLYEDWAIDCRELARSAALELSRLLARAATARGDDEAGSRHLHRILERDPYDADAWIALVAAQARLRRYGEARRQHAIYARRMAELDIAPLPLAQCSQAPDPSGPTALRPH